MSEDMVNEFVSKLFDKVLNEISKEWKAKTDETIKLMKKEYNRLLKKYERLSDALDIKSKEHNQFIHQHNMKCMGLNILNTKLQSQILKLQNQIDKMQSKVNYVELTEELEK